MAIHVFDSMGKLASRFVHELLLVALASVIGTLVVNHYGRQPASPSLGDLCAERHGLGALFLIPWLGLWNQGAWRGVGSVKKLLHL